MEDITSFTVADAAALAAEAHRGQVDKQQRPYLEAHLGPVAELLRPFGEPAVMAGYLHDIVEDTDHSAQSLAEHGVPAEVVEAVVSVTRLPEETYLDLIERARCHPLGRLVKLADNTLNLRSNPGLARTDPELAAAMLKDRYVPARSRLLDGLPDRERVEAAMPVAPPAEPA